MTVAGPYGALAASAMDVELYRTDGTRVHEVVPNEVVMRVWSDTFVLVSANSFVRGTSCDRAAPVRTALRECGAPLTKAGTLMEAVSVGCADLRQP